MVQTSPFLASSDRWPTARIWLAGARRIEHLSTRVLGGQPHRVLLDAERRAAAVVVGSVVDVQVDLQPLLVEVLAGLELRHDGEHNE